MLSDCISEVLEQLKRRASGGAFDSAQLDLLVTVEAPRLLMDDLLPEAGYSAIGSTKQGSPADVPWVALFPAGSESSAKVAVYLVYLFAKDGSRAYLSLIQGTENVRGGIPPLLKRVQDLRDAASVPEELRIDLDLRSTNQQRQAWPDGRHGTQPGHEDPRQSSRLWSAVRIGR